MHGYQVLIRAATVVMVDAVAVAGATFGVCVQLFANSCRRVPLNRYPYMHVALGAAGYYLLPLYDQQVEIAKVKVAEKQREKMERNITFEA